MTVDNKFVDFLKQKFSKLFADKSEFQAVKEDVDFLTEGGVERVMFSITAVRITSLFSTVEAV